MKIAKSINSNVTYIGVFNNAFGMQLQNRHESVTDFRYGFNGMEKDDEVKNDPGTSYDFGARIYDPRVGRWLSRDPSFNDYPSISPYVFAINSPNWFIDPNGKWVVDIQKNAEGEYHLVFYAQENDNLTTLATQLGLPAGTILNAHPELEGMDLCEGSWLTLENIEQVKNINGGINFIGKNQTLTNCSALADNCDGGKVLSIVENDLGRDVESYEKKISNEYTEILNEKDAQIGDVITYRLTGDWKDGEIQAVINASSARKKLAESDPETAIRVFGKETQTIYEVERHFSVIVLMDKNGEHPSSIIQKNGRGDFDFKVDSAKDLTVPTDGISSKTDLEYEPKPIKGKTSPIYRQKEKTK